MTSLRCNKEVLFNLGSLFLIPELIGVYVFFDYQGTIYVGLSKNLRKRISDHHDGKTHSVNLIKRLRNPIGTLRVGWIVLSNIDEAKALEKYLIKKLSPSENVIFNPKKKES